jgi:hypothetical protein
VHNFLDFLYRWPSLTPLRLGSSPRLRGTAVVPGAGNGIGLAGVV